MRLAKLSEFRRLIFTPTSAPPLAELCERIHKIPGGLVRDGKYFVDVDVFERVHKCRIPFPREPRPRRRQPFWNMPADERAQMEAYYAHRAADRILKQSAAHSRKRKVVIRRATPPWADLDAIAIYSKAREQRRRTGIAHCVDHIIPLQGKLVCGLHVETNLRVVTSSANSRKHNRFSD